MNNRGELIIRFWGVRGSYAVPGSAVERYGGNTACVEVEAGDSTVILDAGTGIIPLGRDLARRAREQGRKVSCVLLFSHLHHDHTQGFPFFVPAFLPGTNLHLYGPDFFGSSPRAALEEIMQPPFFPIRLADLSTSITFGVLHESDMLLLSEQSNEVEVRPARTLSGKDLDPDSRVRVRVMRSYAHPGGVLHYRIDWQGSSVVYATDTEGYVNGDQRLSNFARGADLLIHDAQYTDEHYLGLAPGLSVTQGYGHSTISMACQAAVSSGAKQLALFHHAPEYSDEQLDRITGRAREIFPNTLVASEGLTICLRAGSAEYDLAGCPPSAKAA